MSYTSPLSEALSANSLQHHNPRPKNIPHRQQKLFSFTSLDHYKSPTLHIIHSFLLTPCSLTESACSVRVVATCSGVLRLPPSASTTWCLSFHCPSIVAIQQLFSGSGPCLFYVRGLTCEAWHLSIYFLFPQLSLNVALSELFMFPRRDDQRPLPPSSHFSWGFQLISFQGPCLCMYCLDGCAVNILFVISPIIKLHILKVASAQHVKFINMLNIQSHNLAISWRAELQTVLSEVRCSYTPTFPPYRQQTSYYNLLR